MIFHDLTNCYVRVESEYLQIMDVSSNTISLKREPSYNIGADLSGTITQITLQTNSENDEDFVHTMQKELMEVLNYIILNFIYQEEVMDQVEQLQLD